MSDIKGEAQTCSHCMYEMHTFEGCYNKPKRKSSNIEVIEKKEVNTDPKKTFGLILSNVTKHYVNLQEKEKWIEDSGATVHITNNDAGMFNVKKCNFDITVGNQETTKCTKMSDIQLKLKNSTGKTVIFTLFNVRYVPTFIGILFNISTAMSNGAEIRFRNNKKLFLNSSQQIQITVVPYLVLMLREKLVTVKWHLRQRNKMKKTLLIKKNIRFHLIKI